MASSESTVPAATTAVAVLGVAGFLVHIGPVYGGDGAAGLAAQPLTTWVGAGGIALLLGGLLAAAATRQVPAATHHRDGAAVTSLLGTLAVIVGLLDPPADTTTGWALIVIAVLAVLQSALALVGAVRPAPATSRLRTSGQQQLPAQSPFNDESFSASGTHASSSPLGYGRGAGTGAADEQARYTSPPWMEAPRTEAPRVGQPHPEQPAGEPPAVESRTVTPADRPTAPVFVPPPSSAPTGAQPAGPVTAAPSPVWGGRAQPATQRTDRGGGGGGHAPEGFTPGGQ